MKAERIREILTGHGIDYVEQSGRIMALGAIAYSVGEWFDVTDSSAGDLTYWLGY